ncbi:unnamed protein product [Paramecium primaurelia]|uniref:Uncharacterized protein n=2 Tax=Paramecium TaxID=5884 RepID=A0A8S1UBH9_9CILI|nr:unnamed protein product [Paramecium primaurelia]CAD8162591.1 unnamed protein product [Paramecium pentaurelia]
METESKIQQKFLNLRQVAPPILGSIHYNKSPNLEQLDQLAQISVKRRMKSNDPQKTEPTYRDIHKNISKQKEEINKIKKTKQPSLPYLPKKQKEFYNKWYIPYDQRYVQKPDFMLQKYEDELHFYKNMHNMYVQYNPFDQNLPEDLMKKIGNKERTEALKEILKGQKQIIEFKRSLEKEKQRVPEFIKQLMEAENKNQKQKQQFQYQ